MKKLVWLLLAVIVLTGCVNARRFAMSPAEEQRLIQQADARRQALADRFPDFVAICLGQFPDGQDARNDGSTHMSDSGAVNVSMKAGGRDIVCSVNTSNMQVERIYQANLIRDLEEYKAYVWRNALGHAEKTEFIEPDPPENDPRFSYKGVRIGDSLARFKSKLPLYECKNGYCSFSKSSCESSYHQGPKGSIKECTEGTSYGGSSPSRGFVTFIDGKVASINLTLESNQIPMLDIILREKYGKAKTIDNTVFMNKVGTQFPNTKRTWLIEGETLITTLRSSVVDEGMVEIRGKAEQQRSIEAAQKRIHKNKQDF